MKVLKTKIFNRWARKNKVTDSALYEAAYEIKDGNYNANLGGGILKKRIANKGRGKRSSTRTIVAFKKGKNCFFIYGFEKNVKSNLSETEEEAMKKVAKIMLDYTDREIQRFIKSGNLVEICDGKK